VAADKFSKIDFGRLKANLHHAAIAVFLLACVLGGGASRNDALSQPIVWLAAILCISTCLLVIKPADMQYSRGPLVFLGLCAALVILQLIPLPPALWSAFPGRDAYQALPEIAGFAPPWRPFTVTPDLTWSSLLSLLPLAAMIVAYATMSDAFRRFLVPGLACVCVISAVLGLAQLGGGDGGPLRFYEVTNRDFAVGFFANRNHQAVLLVLGIPLIVVAARLSASPQVAKFALWISSAIILFMLPMILVTGARIGIILAVYTVAIAAVISRTSLPARYTRRRHSTPNTMQRYIAPAVILGIVVFTVALSRAVAIDRIFATDAQQELRLIMIKPLVTIFWAFFPLGSGFGSFEPIFRQYEPFELLRPGYMNQAHNDVLQLAIEGGVPALLLAAVLGVWVIIAGLRLWRARPAEISRVLLIGRFAAAMLPVFFIASLFDYPLRTPLLGVVFVLLLLWVKDGLQSLGRQNHSKGKDDAFTTLP
jgi:hypothetical protein